MKNENEVIIASGKYDIKPVKVKYMKKGFYGNYMTIRHYNYVQLMGLEGGEQIVLDFVTAIFDNEELAKKLIEDIDAPTMKVIVDIVQKINEIEEEPNPN